MLETPHQAGAVVDFRDNNGQTALIFALHNPQCVKLLEQGADMNASSKSGFTPITFCIHFNTPESLKILLSKGADYHAALPGGSNLAHLEVQHATVSTLNVLAEFRLWGLDFAAVDDSGLTAAALAASLREQSEKRTIAIKRFFQSVNEVEHEKYHDAKSACLQTTFDAGDAEALASTETEACSSGNKKTKSKHYSIQAASRVAMRDLITLVTLLALVFAIFSIYVSSIW